MVIDASAVLAILLGEKDAPAFAAAIESASSCRMSAVSHFEAALVIDNCGDAYALAKLVDEPLLYKGRDFSRTDIPAVL